jgi:hypothetical protein
MLMNACGLSSTTFFATASPLNARNSATDSNPAAPPLRRVPDAICTKKPSEETHTRYAFTNIAIVKFARGAWCPNEPEGERLTELNEELA